MSRVNVQFTMDNEQGGNSSLITNHYLLCCLLFALAVQSCMVGPNFQPTRDTIDSVEVYRFDSLQLAMTDSVLNIKWWEMFQDPIIDTLISIGLAENKDVLIASARIEQARAALGKAKAEIWPSFGYTGAAQRGNSVQGLQLPNTTNAFNGFGTLHWEIDFWGKFRRASEAARAELLASEYGRRTVQIGLISLITGTYYQLLDFKWRLDISIKTLELRQESEDIIQARFNEGIVAEIDLNQAQIQRAIAAGAVPVFQRQVAQTENALSILLGRNPGPIPTGTELQNQMLTLDIPVGIPSMLMTRRPDLLQLEELLHAQNARIGIAVAQRFPSISLTGLLGVASTELSEITDSEALFNIGGSIMGPLFEFGRNKRRVEIERAITEQVLYEYEFAVITAFQEVEDALVEISTLKEEMVARRDHVAAAENAQFLSGERYDKGVTSYLEIIESQRQAFEAQLNLSQTTQQLFNAYVRLYKALGGGWLSEEEMMAAQQANQSTE